MGITYTKTMRQQAEAREFGLITIAWEDLKGMNSVLQAPAPGPALAYVKVAIECAMAHCMAPAASAEDVDLGQALARWITAVEGFVEHRDMALEPFATREWLELRKMLDDARAEEEEIPAPDPIPTSEPEPDVAELVGKLRASVQEFRHDAANRLEANAAEIADLKVQNAEAWEVVDKLRRDYAGSRALWHEERKHLTERLYTIAEEAQEMRRLASQRLKEAAKERAQVRGLEAAVETRQSQLEKWRDEARHHRALGNDPWHWMHDGNDHLEGIACPILIHPDHLRELCGSATRERQGASLLIRIYFDLAYEAGLSEQEICEMRDQRIEALRTMGEEQP